MGPHLPTVCYHPNLPSSLCLHHPRHEQKQDIHLYTTPSTIPLVPRLYLFGTSYECIVITFFFKRTVIFPRLLFHLYWLPRKPSHQFPQLVKKVVFLESAFTSTPSFSSPRISHSRGYCKKCTELDISKTKSVPPCKVLQVTSVAETVHYSCQRAK